MQPQTHMHTKSAFHPPMYNTQVQKHKYKHIHMLLGNDTALREPLYKPHAFTYRKCSLKNHCWDSSQQDGGNPGDPVQCSQLTLELSSLSPLLSPLHAVLSLSLASFLADITNGTRQKPEGRPGAAAMRTLPGAGD